MNPHNLSSYPTPTPVFYTEVASDAQDTTTSISEDAAMTTKPLQSISGSITQPKPTSTDTIATGSSALSHFDVSSNADIDTQPVPSTSSSLLDTSNTVSTSKPSLAKTVRSLTLDKESVQASNMQNLAGCSNNFHTVTINGKEASVEDIKLFVSILKNCNNLKTLNLVNIEFGGDYLFRDTFNCPDMFTLSLESSTIDSFGAELLANSLKHRRYHGEVFC